MGNSRATFELLLKFWPVGRFFNWLGRKPPFSILFNEFFSQKHNHAIMIPVNQVISGTESLVLPEKVLRPLVEMASDLYVLNECPCRKAERCQHYPHDLGCLFLGRGAEKIHPSMARPVTSAEALAHIRRAVGLGLMPSIIHAAFDAYMLGIPYNQMLAVCFCCECCCTVRSGLRMGPQAFCDAVERLPNLQLEVTDACCGCELCAQECVTQAIEMVDQRPVIGERCKGCGHCASICPVDAIQLKIDRMEDVTALVANRIRSRTDIGLPV